MTEELYYTSAYITEFFAKVISCDKADNGYEIILDRTAFFPEHGGQGCDSGVLELVNDNMVNDPALSKRAKVQHVSIEQNHGANGEITTTIKHLVDMEIPVGATVHGIIDWNHRFSNMQQHTGEHVFSGLVNSKFGYDNVGFHLSDSEVTMDYNGVLSADDVKELELLANQAIWDNLDVLCEFPGEEELLQISYRSKKELEGDVRIVTIPGIDICACCAPHVLKTGEIGMLKVVGLQNYKGGVRVNILCGKRALEYIQAEHEIVSELSGMLTTSTDKVTASVKRAFEDNAALKAELNKARESLIDIEIEELLEQNPGEDIMLVKDDSYDSNMMRKLVNGLADKKNGFCGVFAGSADKGYRFIIGSGAGDKDCRELCNKLRSEFGAKGGGSPKMIQGSLTTDNISEVLQECRSN